MNTSEYKIFWIENLITPRVVTSFELKEALVCCEDLRTRRRNGEPISFITMCGETSDQVGQMGVDSVIDGKTPDGNDYTWSKRRRGTK